MKKQPKPKPFEKWFVERYEAEPSAQDAVTKATWGSFRRAYQRTIELQRRYLSRIDQLTEEGGT